MTRNLSPLLFGLLLVAAVACKKEDPEPKLEGTWILANETRVMYDQNDVEIRRDVTSTKEFRANITQDSVVYFRIADARRMLAYGYTRDGMNLTFSSGAVPHIEELTNNRLVWKNSQAIGYSPGRVVSTLVFTR